MSFLFFDDGNFHSQLGSPYGADISARTGANYDEIICIGHTQFLSNSLSLYWATLSIHLVIFVRHHRPPETSMIAPVV